MAEERNVQTFLLTITVLPQPGGVHLRRAVHGIKNVLDKSKVHVVHQFKVSGESKVLAVVDVSDNRDLENLVEAVWDLGSIDVISSPLLHYSVFARNLGVAEELVTIPAPKLDKDHLYWLEVDVEYHGKTLEELLTIWKSEAEAVFTLRKAGAANIIPFKSLGQRKVNAFGNHPVAGAFDKLTFELPIVVGNGSNVHIKNKAIQFLDEYTKAHPL
ncbi:hypothetical protein BsWGS_10335 [Bradybaena similaris]